MAELDAKFVSLIGKEHDISHKLEPIERRLKTLDEHLRQGENFMCCRRCKVQYEKLYAQYEPLKATKGWGAKGKAQKALDAANEYYDANRSQITLFESAEWYLRGVLQKHFGPNKLPPISKWKGERERLIAEKQLLDRDYWALKSEVAEAEKVRRGVYDIVRGGGVGSSRTKLGVWSDRRKFRRARSPAKFSDCINPQYLLIIV